MSKYDNLRKTFGEAPAEDKLKILRHEMLHPIGVIRGYTRLLSSAVEDLVGELPKDFEIYINNIVVAGDDLLEVLEALTDTEASE